MENRIVKLAILLTAIIGVGIFVQVLNVSISGDKYSDKTSIVGYKLAIAEHDGICELVCEGKKGIGKLPLGPKPPCRFLTRPDGHVLFYSYEDVNVNAVLIVIGTPTKPDPRFPVTMNKKNYCGDEIQGIIIRDDGVFVTVTDRGYGMCTNLGADEKIFWLFAHEEKLIGPVTNNK